MKLVLAEKPSVAQSIAKVLGATKREDGYLEGNGYVVSWCVGHLVELSQPEAYDEKYNKWAYGTGGRSHALSGASGSGEDHDAKGIRYTKSGCDKVQLSWTQVANRIDSLIKQERYISPEVLKDVQQERASDIENEPNPVGRIEYLGTNGRPGEVIEYTDPEQFIKNIEDETFYGVPWRSLDSALG